MLGERRPADLKGLAARFACSAAAGAEAAHFDENDELLAGQFRDGEFVGEPDSPLNPETTEEEERELRRLGEESLQPGTAAHAAAVQISQLIERFIYVDSRPFRFVTDYRGARHNREYLKPLYDLCKEFPKGSRNIVLHTGRQVEKSTTQAAKSIVLGTMMPSFKSLYVAPRFDQVSIFSNQRFKPMAEDGPNLKPFIRPSKTEWKVGSKTFLNRSSYNFRSCYMTADNCRGISAHHLMLDELQDLLSDNINVLEQCQSHYGWDTGLCFRTYAGTPKTNNNPLSRRYQQSSQFEYLIRCMACNHWNYPDENIIGPTCYICTRCGREIFPHRDGKWEPMNKAALPEMWGFRIPQIVVPFKNHSDVHRDMTSPNISRLTFHNEVLGLPYDEGELVLTDGDMQRACEPGVPMWTIEQIGLYARQGKPIFGGVDYGTGEGQSPSFTVLALGHFDEHDVFHVRYLQRFTGKLAALAPQPALISRLATGAGCRFMFADWGFGAHQNARLVAEFGWDWLNGAHVLAQVMYVGQRRIATFDNQLFIYKVDRNQSMIAHIDSIKQGRTKFFRAEEMQPFFADHTTIYTEYNDTYGTTKYDHVEPDDAFHAVHYARMAGLQYYGKLTPQALPDVTKLDLDDLGY